MTDDATARIEALEFKVAHLERASQELSDVLYRQQQEIDRLLEVNRQLGQQIGELANRTAEATTEEIPPHY